MTSPESRGWYRIRVKGVLNPGWSEWFAGLDVHDEEPDTVISGHLPDQAALHGVLNKIRDLDLFLISVSYRDADEVESPAPASSPASTP